MELIGERRKLNDRDGRELTVFESGNDGQRCLFFDGIDSVRRVKKYPTLWRDLSDDELLALSWTV